MVSAARASRETNSGARIAALRGPLDSVLDVIRAWRDDVARFDDPLYAGPAAEIEEADQLVLAAAQALAEATEALDRLSKRVSGGNGHKDVTHDRAA